MCFSMHPTLFQLGTEKHMLCVSACVPHCSKLGLRGTCYVMCFSMHPTLLQLGTERHTVSACVPHAPTWDSEAHAVFQHASHCSNLRLRGMHCVSAHTPHCSNLGLRGTHCVSACIPHCSSLEPRATCYAFQSASHIAPTWDREARAMCFSMCPTLFQLGTERYMLCVSACIPYCSELGLRGTCCVFQCATHIAPTWD